MLSKWPIAVNWGLCRFSVCTFGLCFRSVEYCLKQKSLMYSTRSSKLRKSSKKAQKSPSWREDVIQRRTRGSRRTGQREARPTESVVISDVGTDHDLINLIEDEGEPVEVVDESLSKSEDGDNDSVSGHSFSSTASGPSLLHTDSLVKQSSPQGWCSGCRKLYQKAKKMTTPLKDKLLDNGEHKQHFKVKLNGPAGGIG